MPPLRDSRTGQFTTAEKVKSEQRIANRFTVWIVMAFLCGCAFTSACVLIYFSFR